MNYGKYCKFQLIKTSHSIDQSVDSAWDGRGESDEVFIECYCNFLCSDTGKQCITTFAEELEQAALHTDDNNGEDDNDDDNDDHMRQQHLEVEEWMLLCRLNQQFNDSATDDV